MFSSFVAHKHGIDLTKEAFDRAYAGIATNLEESKVLRDYLLWRTLVENEQFHLGRMKASEWMKGYISTTRAVTTAKHFAGRWGWVFVTLVRGGFVVPENGKHAWSGYNEQEIAFPGALPWAECIGFRQMDSSAADNRRGKFCGPVYLRKGFEARNAKAFTQVFDLLCGKKQ
jgi:hypothetical protein